MSMADIPQAAKLSAYEQVLDRYDTDEMSAEEKAEILQENEGSIRRLLRDMGHSDAVDSAEMDKSGNPTDMLSKGIYDGTEGRGTTTVNPELASEIEEKFAPEEVEATDPSESASLGIFYGGEVESAASSNRGDSAHSSGNQAE